MNLTFLKERIINDHESSRTRKSTSRSTMPRYSHSSGQLFTGIALGALLLLGSIYIFSLDWENPEVALTPDTRTISKTLELILTAKDKKTGVALVRVEAVRKDADLTRLVEKTFTPPQKTATVHFTLADLPWKNGEVTLDITVRDASRANLLRGNTVVIQRKLVLDTTPPILSVTSGTLNIKQGGCAAITFTANEELTTTGIRIGNLRFPAFKQEKGDYICLFTFPWNFQTRDFQPVLFGNDLAGNERNMHLTVHTSPNGFQHEAINLTDAFLDRKMPEFEEQVPGIMSNLDRYLTVNSKLREANEKKICEVAYKTATKPLWTGSFKRFKGKSMATFAETRTYRYNGRNVDMQTHLGVDIASLEKSEVPAANHGNIVFADNLGIYGLTVIIDHGLGLQTVYSHLSEIVIQIGDQVRKGQTIGRTGTTGLASGDHLHFQVMVSGIAATPVEWWDPHWIRFSLADRIPTIWPNVTDIQTANTINVEAILDKSKLKTVQPKTKDNKHQPPTKKKTRQKTKAF